MRGRREREGEEKEERDRERRERKREGKEGDREQALSPLLCFYQRLGFGYEQDVEASGEAEAEEKAHSHGTLQSTSGTDATSQPVQGILKDHQQGASSALSEGRAGERRGQKKTVTLEVIGRQIEEDSLGEISD
ncbi:hypothetical protein WMY93_022287 [Mugilogobius chulae]|uniref:Uncharacterized protein n=1 Tax=Mugilogobius chulae TaxID=88201 RepID=A0AAW0NBG8_9GOBI